MREDTLGKPARAGFPRSLRIRKRKDFVRIQRTGVRFQGRHLMLVALSSLPTKEASRGRLGLTVSRKVGGAVVRNRVKRWLRASYRGCAFRLPVSVDAVAIARPSAAKAGFSGLSNDIESCLQALTSQWNRGHRLTGARAPKARRRPAGPNNESPRLSRAKGSGPCKI